MRTIKFLSMMALISLTLFACQKSSVIDENVIGAETAAKKSMETYAVTFGELNNSGVMGMAELTLDGNMLTVEINASGLEANMLHPQHIHGFADSNANSQCPPMSADVNNDGYVDLVEGLPFYGGVLLSLQPFPTADANGNINYMETFTLTQAQLDELHPLQNNSIVLHGMTVNGSYVATLPVACGQIYKSQSQGRGNR